MSIPQCTKGPSALFLLQSRYMLEPANSSEMRPARASRPRLAWPPAATWTCSTGAPTATRSWAETSRAPGAGSGGAWGSVCFRQLGRSEVPIFGWFSCFFPNTSHGHSHGQNQNCHPSLPMKRQLQPPQRTQQTALRAHAHTHTTQRNTNPIAHPPTATAGTGTTGNTGSTGNTGNTGKTGNTGTTGNRDNSEHRENREHRDHRATRTAGHVNRKTSAARSGRAQGRTHVSNQRFRKLRYVTSDHYMVDLESGSVTDFGSMEDAKAACETMGTVPRGSRRVGRAAKRAHHLRNPTE